jgi:tetratricopeptide (TPR) repeat protein
MKTNWTYLKILLAVSIILILASGCGESEKKSDLKTDGMKALESSDFLKAINYFRDALQDNPSDRDLLYYLGLSYKRYDMFDSAYAYFKRAHILYVRDREINQELLDLCPMYGDFDGAINAIAVLITTGDNEKMYYSQLAEFYLQKGENSMAIKYYKLLIDENPDDKRWYLRVAGLLTEEQKFDQSIGFLNQLNERFGPSAEAYANLAINYISTKQLDKAEDAFRTSLSLDPENIPVWINLANLLTERDNREKKAEALEIYKKYYSQTPKFYNLDSLIPALEEELK